jgi:Hypothetical glycosyl hydrolase family 15
MSWKRSLALVLASAATLSIAGTAGAAAVSATRICTNCVSRGDLSRYEYVTLNAGDFPRIRILKALNPRIKVLVYKDMASTRSWDCAGGVDRSSIAAGVGYCWARTHHPDWFTLDEAGARIEWDPWPDHWQMDIGSPAYQDAWAANVISELKARGWDGVTIDNANVDQSVYVGERQMREYPTQPSYQAATRSFLARVGPRIRAAGLLVLPNIQAHPVLAGPRVWADWTRFTSGGTREYWMKWGTGYEGHFSDRGWDDLQKVFETVQRARKIFLTSTTAPNDDVRSMRWGRASFLLSWNGGPSAFAFDSGKAVDPWSPEWTIDVGRPLGRRQRVGNVWKRRYTDGVVLANVSKSASQRVRLGRSYVHPSGRRVTTVTLRPTTGLILQERRRSRHMRTGGAAPERRKAAHPAKRPRTTRRS